jgi:Uma2 family endonuclease
VPTSAAKARSRPTYADIEALPPHLSGEIIAGELVASPRPAGPHIHACSTLGAYLGSGYGFGVGGPGGWWIEDEPELHLGIDPDYEPLIPDLAGWRRERMPHIPESHRFVVVPDWVCEALSPSTASIDRAEKMPFYARAGVGHLWLCDAGLRVLEVFALDGDAWKHRRTVRGDIKVRLEPFEATEIDLARVWER